MMLLQHSRGFLKAVFQSLGCFQLLEIPGPLTLPVQGETAEAKHGYTQAQQGTIGDAVQISQQRRLLIGASCGERPLDQLERPGGGSPLTLLGLVQRCGDHKTIDELRK
jgi:hypothetical protein